MSLTSIQEEIVRLSSTERAKLIDILWESLDEERVKEIEAKWTVESEDRIDAVDRGDLETIDGPSALRDLRSSLRKWRENGLGTAFLDEIEAAISRVLQDPAAWHQLSPRTRRCRTHRFRLVYFTRFVLMRFSSPQ